MRGSGSEEDGESGRKHERERKLAKEKGWRRELVRGDLCVLNFLYYFQVHLREARIKNVFPSPSFIPTNFLVLCKSY